MKQGNASVNRLLATVIGLGLVLVGCGGGSALGADAGEDFSVPVGVAPEFDGCGSTGEISNYAWTIIEAPVSDAAGKELRETQSGCDFTLENAMVIDDVGEWTIELVVTDGDAEAADQVVVTVSE